MSPRFLVKSRVKKQLVQVVTVAIFLLLLDTFDMGRASESENDVFLVFEDLSSSPTSFETNKLPRDATGNLLTRYMATIGNGHLGTAVFSDTLFINGVYNGFKGESHRARIPSRNNIRVRPARVSEADLSNHSLALNVQSGLFVESFISGKYRVVHRIFAHRYYHTTIFNQIEVEVLSGRSEGDDQAELELELTLQTEQPDQSMDFDFEPEVKYESVFPATTLCGRTKEVEDTHYQPETTALCIISSDLPPTLTIKTGGEIHTFFTSYGKSMTQAQTDFDVISDLVTENKHHEILESHTSRWEQMWEGGRIEVEGNLRLSKVINGCLYYILSSLPITGTTNSAVGNFYGLSPGGLANGGYLSDFQGHSFWDTEMWIFPPILYLFPEAAKELLNYRLLSVQAARDRAVETGLKGVRFAWESCYTGREVTPDCCPETREYQIHNTADVAFALRQYISLTRDLDWLTDIQPGFVTHGLGLLREIAHFWISKMEFDPISRQHDIRHVMSPDDDHYDKDNSVYTNVVAAYSVFFAKYAECLANMSLTSKGQPRSSDEDNDHKGEDESTIVPDDWVNRAKSLKLLYDPHLNYHPEYEGYPLGESIKQADVVLLGFPLIYQMDPSTRKNDLLIYGNATRTNGPGMTWSMHSIAFLELDDLPTAEYLFNRSYQPYVRWPFNLWTEAQPPTLGAVNYLTGMGGFLQAIISGYGGFRLLPEKIIFKPRLLPQSTRWKIIGLKYLDNVLNLDIEENRVSISLTLASPKYSLTIELPNGSTTGFTASRVIVLELHPELTHFEVKATPSKCPLPLDTINESYESNQATNIHWFKYHLTTACLTYVFFRQLFR